MARFKIINSAPACLSANVPSVTAGACCTTYAELLDTSGNTWIVFSTFNGPCSSTDTLCNANGITTDQTVGEYQEQWLQCESCDGIDVGSGLCNWLAGTEAQALFGGDATVVQVGVVDGLCTGFGADLTVVQCTTGPQPTTCPPGQALDVTGNCSPIDPPVPVPEGFFALDPTKRNIPTPFSIAKDCNCGIPEADEDIDLDEVQNMATVIYAPAAGVTMRPSGLTDSGSVPLPTHVTQTAPVPAAQRSPGLGDNPGQPVYGREN